MGVCGAKVLHISQKANPAMSKIPLTRAENMSRIGGKDTGPELSVRAMLRGMGIGYRLHRKDLPGKPDIVLVSRRVCIFVHGCFWHRHGCHESSTPKTNGDFWLAKFARNVCRDRRVQRQLRGLGWRVLVVWECRLREPEKVEARLRRELG
ncbi:MAG: mismatch endonuclease Vsr [Verrucomicrobiota bacterium]